MVATVSSIAVMLSERVTSVVTALAPSSRATCSERASSRAAITTFALTRANLSNQRESSVLSQVYANANIVRNRLPELSIEEIQSQLLPSLQVQSGSRPLSELANVNPMQ